jgi:hypothetical protein
MDLYTLTTFLADCGSGYLVLILLISIFFYRKNDGLRKFIIFYLVLMTCTDLVCTYVGRTYGSNQIILPIYCFVELSFFFYLFVKYMFKQPHSFVSIFGCIGLVYIVFEFFYNFIYHQVSTQDYQPYAKVVDNFIIIVFSLTYLLEKISAFSDSRLENFSLNMGLLINFTLSTIFFLPFNFMLNEKSEIKFYLIHS